MAKTDREPAEQNKKYWKITAWDGTNLLFERKVLSGQITEKSMKKLLRTLTAKFSLSEEEIINSYAKKGTKIYNDKLQVTRDVSCRLICGDNPYVTAIIVNEV